MSNGPNQKPEVDLRHYGRHLVKSIWRYSSIGGRPICITFGSPLQNHMPVVVKRSKSKPEVKFHYGGAFFSETVSSNISAVHWDIWSKYGTLIALDLQKCQTWPNQKPKVDLRRYGRNLVKSTWRHNSVADLFRAESHTDDGEEVKVETGSRI